MKVPFRIDLWPSEGIFDFYDVYVTKQGFLLFFLKNRVFGLRRISER